MLGLRRFATLTLLFSGRGTPLVCSPWLGAHGGVTIIPSGFCGTSITEGVYDFTEMADTLGRPFRIQEFKYVRQSPCCRANHGVLDSVLSLMREQQFDFRDVERVELDQA